MATTTYPLLLFAFFLLLIYLISRFYPSPLPSIPHRPTTRRPLGDLLSLIQSSQKSREPSESLFALARETGSPISQILFTAFNAPLIVVDDPREAEDILLRRNREFDRSPLTSELFEPVIPRCTLAQLTTPELKAQKRLWGDVMGLEFLRGVVAPNIHVAAGELMELWRLKAKISETATATATMTKEEGVEVTVKADFNHAALDAIWVAILGSKLGAIRRDIEALKLAAIKKGTETEREKEERERKLDDMMRSATVIQESVEFANEVVDAGLNAAWPAFTYFLMRLRPSFHRKMKVTFDEMRRLMTSACERYAMLEVNGEKGDGEELDTCAMDLVLRREIITARKMGKPMPDPTRDPRMLEELLLLLLAGHDSTANTLMWFVKYMTAHQSSQGTLRRAIQSAFPNGTPDSAAAILNADIPYLDATIEETLRIAGTAAITARKVLCDTTILGYHIPKGSNILLNTRMIYPPRNVPEHLRSPTSQAAQAKRPRGGLEGENGRDLETFEPRRWLTKNEQGKEIFDAYALPSLVFGGGYRGCFGKRLAMQELKIMIVHMILNFEFLPLPEEQSSMLAVEKIFRSPRVCSVKLRAL